MIRRRILLEKEDTKFVTNGLTRWWDAIENTPNGHETYPTYWTDRISSVTIGSNAHSGGFTSKSLPSGSEYSTYGMSFVPYPNAWTFMTVMEFPVGYASAYGDIVNVTYYRNPGRYRWGFYPYAEDGTLFWNRNSSDVLANYSYGNGNAFSDGGRRTIAFRGHENVVSAFIDGEYIGTGEVNTNWHMPGPNELSNNYLNTHFGRTDRNAVPVNGIFVWDRELSDSEMVQHSKAALKYYDT